MKKLSVKARHSILSIVLPIIAILAFLGVWQGASQQIQTNIGNLPGPVEVLNAFKGLMSEFSNQREAAKTFYANLPEGSTAIFSAPPTFIDQILTSLKTVLTACIISSMIAIPVGLLCGLSPNFYRALNPLIQIFKPISPLAWLPIVSLLVASLYVHPIEGLSKSFVISAITVAMCTIWPTLINTMVGVGQISQDFMNVSKVLNLSWYTHLTKIVLPAIIPMVFTGLLLSVGVGWMVLIAAEMLAQNPGLGKFVWDEFQNGSSLSTSRIFVAVITIGLIGFALDRIMLMLQRRFSWDKSLATR